jgi:hypothetical protein
MKTIIICLIAAFSMALVQEPKIDLRKHPVARAPNMCRADRVSEIYLEEDHHTGVLPSPRYFAILNQSCGATYTGIRGVKRIGTFRGVVRCEDFAQLATLIVEKGFFQMKDANGDLPLTMALKLAIGNGFSLC